MIWLFDCTFAPQTTGGRQLDFCLSYPHEPLLYAVYSIPVPVQRYIIFPVSHITFNLLSPAFLKLLYYYFSHYTPSHCLKSLLRVSQPPYSQPWVLFMRLQFFSLFFVHTVHFLLCKGLLSQPVHPVGGGCPCLAHLFITLPSFTSWAQAFTVSLHSLPFYTLVGFYTSHAEMLFRFPTITLLPCLPPLSFTLVSFATLWPPYLFSHTLPPECRKPLFPASHCLSPHWCPFLKWTQPWEAVGRCLRCHVGRTSTANLHGFISETYNLWFFTLICSSRK